MRLSLKEMGGREGGGNKERARMGGAGGTAAGGGMVRETRLMEGGEGEDGTWKKCGCEGGQSKAWDGF